MKDRLYRSRRVRVFGGVGGGLADYFNIDPIIIRILFIVLTIMHGMGLLIYIILWIVVPEESFESAYKIEPSAPASAASANSDPTSDTSKSADASFTPPVMPLEMKKSGTGRIVAGVILIVLGLTFFADRIIPGFDFDDMIPIVFVIIGGALIWNSLKK